VARLTQRQVQSRVQFWQKRLGLQAWRFAVRFGRMDDEAEAACMAQPEYLHAILHFDLSQIPVDELDSYVAHEITHALVWPLANAAHTMAGGDQSKEEWVRTMEEELVTRLEKLFVAMLPD
jgi:hypothetical protein